MSSVDRGAVIQAVSQFFRVPQAYELDNQIVVTASNNLLAIADGVKAEGPLVVADVVGAFFVNRALVKLGTASAEPANQLRKVWQRLRAQEFTVDPGATLEELREFLAAYQRHWRTATPWLLLEERFNGVRLRSVGSATGSANADGVRVDQRQNVLRTYVRVAVLMQDIVQRVQAKQPFRTPLLRKAVQQMHDASTGHEALLAGLTRFRNFRGELHFHLATVAALTLLMGRRLKLGKGTLIDLVMSALFHDLGRTALDVVDQNTDLAVREGLGFRVPALSMLTAADSFTEEALGQATVAFEHSLPARHRDAWAPGVAARLIAVPSFYDLLTSDRPTRRGLAPDQALRILHEQSGTRFDPFMVKLFTATVGLYPVGTTVRLTTGELAIIVEVPTDAALFSKPVVKIIRDERGAVDVIVDLANDATGRAIARSVDTAEENVNPAAFLLA